VVLQDPTNPKQVLNTLAELIAAPDAERLRIAVAYASADGVKALNALLLAAESTLAVEIVVTLDMGITRKAALEILLGGDAVVKVIATGSSPGTFHAKAFVLDRIDAAPRAIVGSANLTYPALTTNYEAVWIGSLTDEEMSRWEAWWGQLVEAAVELTPEVIDQYEERRPPPGRRERIADEDVETDQHGLPTTPAPLPASGAEWLVIDWGGTGEYRVQFEIPQQPAAFFAPVSIEKRSITVRYGDDEYDDNQLRFYSDNGMARINMDPNLPVVQDHSIMRQATLFTRLGSDHYELRLVDRDERTACLAASAAVGGIGHTLRRNESRRRFGWAK
jgi:HKD family nuclease